LERFNKMKQAWGMSLRGAEQSPLTHHTMVVVCASAVLATPPSHVPRKN